MATATDMIPAEVAAAAPTRPRVLLVGTGFGVTAALMAFATMLGVYLAERAAVVADGSPWLPEGATIPLTPGTMGLFTLFLSAVTVWWAVDAVGNDDRPHAMLALFLTGLFGLGYVNAITFLYTQMNLGVATSRQAVLIYSITGLNIAWVLLGIVFMVVMILRTAGGEFAGRDREGVVAAAVFWYAGILVSSIVWYAIFVTK